ncbi:MAG TPA: hypothetical protein DCZ94_07990 [Lentisphaeria bacterium]|nr:MAG: hypothetical protein A2X48_19465 [Lentisphaerae bacterium GWF2_49_21]HBC86878.1 hypothetical protein [Lentisphaeria bacterium]
MADTVEHPTLNFQPRIRKVAQDKTSISNIELDMISQEGKKIPNQEKNSSCELNYERMQLLNMFVVNVARRVLDCQQLSPIRAVPVFV